MAEIINLNEYRIRKSETRLFAPWKKRFERDFDYFTRLSDLPDRILRALAGPGEKAAAALWEIVMAHLKLGPVASFPFLSDDDQFATARHSELLKEQVFFEIMRRLGWLADYPCFRRSLIAIMECFDKGSEFCTGALPEATDFLPDYSEYETLYPELRRHFLTEKFDQALDLFEKRAMNEGEQT